MSNKRAEVFCTGHVGPFAVSCRSLMAVLWCLAGLLAAVPAVLAADADLPPGVVQQESGYYYTIQKGDTLWDLSQRFADTPFYWPEMWKENRQIPNPHRIFPGERIRLFRRQWTAGPPVSGAAQAPEPAKPSEPPSYYHAGIEAVGFMRSQPIAPAATISKLPEDKTVCGQWDEVFVMPAEGVTLLPGDRFIVYRTFEPFIDPADKTFYGYQHYLLGVVQIAEVGPGLIAMAKATVVKSFRDMRVGDQIAKLDFSSDPKIVLTNSKDGIEGKILRAEEDVTMFGDHAVVFINRGAAQGLQRGQQYTIYDPARTHIDPQTKVLVDLPAVDIGSLLVLRTETDTATALVIKAKRDIAAEALIMTHR